MPKLRPQCIEPAPVGSELFDDLDERLGAVGNEIGKTDAGKEK